MKKSTVKAIAAVSTLAAITIGVGAVTSWFTNWNAKTWFNSWGNGSPTASPSDDSQNDPDEDYTVYAYTDDGIAVTDGDELPEHMTFFRNTTDLTAYLGRASIELHATVTPEDADYTIAWSVAFVDVTVNLEATDYVTVTPNPDNSNYCAVECLRPFAYKIVINCAVRDNYGGLETAQCNLDYLCEIGSMNLRVRRYGYGTDGVLLPYHGGAPVDIEMYQGGTTPYDWEISEFVFNYGVGTVRDTIDSSMLVSATYSCYTDGAKQYVDTTDPMRLRLYQYITDYSGVDLLANTKKPQITVTFQFRAESERVYTKSIIFCCNCVKPVTSVELDTSDYLFGA